MAELKELLTPAQRSRAAKLAREASAKLSELVDLILGETGRAGVDWTKNPALVMATRMASEGAALRGDFGMLED
jgi:hypothetical protein